MRFLVRLMAPSESRINLLTSVRALARSVGAESRNPKWTSYGALELDIFCLARSHFDLFLSILRPIAEVEFMKDLNIALAHKSEPELFLEAREYFNAERYWECHEVLEGIWRKKEGAEKRYLQGVILVCAAFVHHQKGEDAVALGVLERAMKQLDSPAEVYGGFNALRLSMNVNRILKTRELAIFRI